MLRKVFSLFLLSVFVFNIIGYYLIFDISDIQIKNQVAETISKISVISNAKMIKVHLSDIREYDKDEIWYNGKLYDILKKETKNDSLFIFILNDQKEEDLITDLGMYVERNFDAVFHGGASKHPVKAEPKNFLEKYLPNAATPWSDNFINTRTIYISTQDLDSSYILSILTPPPEKMMS